jgi:hypothetical protein
MQVQTIEYVKLNGAFQTMELPAQSLFLTYCQVPIMYQVSEKNQLILKVNGAVQTLESNHLTSDLSQKLFGRTDEIESITVCITRDRLKN